jgi:hypothetical protein
MNANELADELEKVIDVRHYASEVLRKEVIKTLRQQQAEIGALKSQSNPYKAITDTKIEATAVSYKPLTKAQEDSIWVEAYQAGFEAGKSYLIQELRKAQEK